MASINNTIMVTVTATDIAIPAIAPADKSSDESLVGIVLLSAILNESKNACNISVEFKLNSTSDSNSKVINISFYAS